MEDKAKVEVEKVEETKVQPKPKKNKKSFVARKLKAINSMQNEALAKRQAERLNSRR